MKVLDVERDGRKFRMVDDNKHTAWILGEMLQEWETDTFDAIDRFCHGGVFVDVGAWMGMFTLWAADRASHIYALECDPIALRMLEANIELNGITNVTVIPKALWNYDGEVVFHTQEFLGDSMTGPTRGGDPHTFDCLSTETLRELVGDNVDLVKIDTEGSESKILPGVIDWMVPIHLSVHEPELVEPLDYGTRNGTRLTTGPYHTVLLH